MNPNGFATSTIVLAFVAGAACGAVVALLLAPKSGRETREDLMQFGTSAARRAVQVPHAMRAAYDSASMAAVQAFNESLVAGNGGAGSTSA